jgi:hypothetical protein
VAIEQTAVDVQALLQLLPDVGGDLVARALAFRPKNPGIPVGVVTGETPTVPSPVSPRLSCDQNCASRPR